MAAARGLTRKQMKHDEFIEKATDFGEWLEENWRTVAIWAGALVAIFILVLAFIYFNKARQDAARSLFGQGYQQFVEAEDPQSETAGDYSAAIETLEQASSKAGGDPIAKVADFYRGIALVRSGEKEEGMSLLEDVAGAGEIDILLMESAKAALANAYAEEGQADKAVDLLRSIADNPDAVYPPDIALVNAGKILQDSGDDAGARRIWQEVADEHAGTAGAAEARTLLN